MLDAFQNKPNAADKGSPAFAAEDSGIIQASVRKFFPLNFKPPIIVVSLSNFLFFNPRAH
jgi:hypothetical protein